MPLVLTEAEGRPAVNSSYFSSINPADGQCLLEKYSDKFSDCNFGLLGNLYACEGKSGKVISLIRSSRICFLSLRMNDGACIGVPSELLCHFLFLLIMNISGYI